MTQLPPAQPHRALPLARDPALTVVRDPALRLVRGSAIPLASGPAPPPARDRTLPLARGRVLPLPPGRCLVMGILNATPDSFSDGGELDDRARRDARIREMLAAGADILDVGGESTRPGHVAVPADQERDRVVPVIQAIRAIDAEVPISIDTSKAAVAQAAMDAGADLVNDVSGLGDPAMAELVRRAGCAIVLMRHEDLDGDIVAGCRAELAAIRARAVAAGIAADAIVLDPGLGFGARPGADPLDNLALIDRLSEYALGHPVLVGASRKRFVGGISGESDPSQRASASVDVALRAARAGAAMVRVHDVAETVTALAAAGLH